MPGSPAILGFLNNPAMLGWLVAAAAPLVIHLLSKRKHREAPWAAMQYLLAALQKNARRIRIEQWILLAVRTLIIVLLVLALAEPFLEQAGLKFVSGQRAHKVLVLDASYSMAYKPADKTLFDRAKQLAARVVDKSSQGDGFTLVLLADPPRVVVGTPAFEPHDFLAEIEALRLPHAGADLPGTITKIEEILETARREHPRLKREEVIFITDLGRTAWRPDLGGPQALAEFRKRSQRLASAAHIVVADLGQPAAENLSLSSLRPLEPFATIGSEVTLEAEVRNHGRQGRSRQLLELYVDGRRAGEQHVDVEPGDSVTASFSYRFDRAGDHRIEVRLAGDLLDIDNHRWLSLPVVEHLRVLCVNGKPEGGAFQGATDYLAVALAPRGPTDDRAPVRPEVVPESALVELDLAQYDCVFLANIGQFTPNEARLLRSYVSGGGGLVIFLGDQVEAASYNERLGRIDQPEGLLPALVGDRVARDEPALLDPLGYAHPLAAAFQANQRAGLLTTPVYQYFKLSLADESPAKVALALDSGDPAIVEAPLGRGRSILVATSADTSWTTMPVWPSYLPIVRELLVLAVRGQLDQRNLRVAESLSGSLRVVESGVAGQVRIPSGEQLPLRRATRGNASRWSFADTLESGFYVAEFGDPLRRSEAYAVNVDTAESDLARLDLDELRSEVWPGVAFEPFDGRDSADESLAPVVRREGLHHFLLSAVLALLFVESTLACWFGRRSV
ncbi:MAG: BatA domain-containing protein [Pirellulales bacterium]